MPSRQPGLRWLLALLVVVALAFAVVGDWAWTGLAVAFGIVLVLRNRRAQADGADDGSELDPD